MKKLSLEIETLEIESFAALPPEPEAADGTVRAFDSSWDEDTCVGPSCRRDCSLQSCYPTC